ncbi:hypothetical protein C0J52_21608 [Blattella germanica]|nr:hypothetical protein C0J52_21608 [Blattella germanica]
MFFKWQSIHTQVHKVTVFMAPTNNNVLITVYNVPNSLNVAVHTNSNTGTRRNSQKCLIWAVRTKNYVLCAFAT